MSKIKAIVITEDNVMASPDNGLSVVALERGGIYDNIPAFVMEALVNSKRARWATADDIAAAVKAAEAAAGGGSEAAAQTEEPAGEAEADAEEEAPAGDAGEEANAEAEEPAGEAEAEAAKPKRGRKKKGE